MRNIAILLGLSAIAVTLGLWHTYRGEAKEPHVRVVNVLNKEMYDDAHISGSIHVSMDKLDQKMQEWRKDVPIVFYCSNYMCQASKDAARKFRENGFQHAYAYEGGMAEWYQLAQNSDAYAVEGPANMVPEYTLSGEPPEPTQEEKQFVISAQELQKLIKNGILPSKG